MFDFFYHVWGNITLPIMFVWLINKSFSNREQNAAYAVLEAHLRENSSKWKYHLINNNFGDYSLSFGGICLEFDFNFPRPMRCELNGVRIPRKWGRRFDRAYKRGGGTVGYKELVEKLAPPKASKSLVTALDVGEQTCQTLSNQNRNSQSRKILLSLA